MAKNEFVRNLDDCFNRVSYEGKCPGGHPVKLLTGYCVFASGSWRQIGFCEKCNSSYHRVILQVYDKTTNEYKFVEGELKRGLC